MLNPLRTIQNGSRWEGWVGGGWVEISGDTLTQVHAQDAA